MRVLLDSSWIQFGPAGRSTYDWGVRVTQPPPMDNLLQDYDRNGLTSNKAAAAEVNLSVVVTVSTLLLLGVVAFIIYRKCARNKEHLPSVITLDLHNARAGKNILSALAPEKRELSDIEAKPAEGVLLMVYLPSPYEESLMRIARAASISSSSKDTEAATAAQEDDGNSEANV